MEIDYEVFKKLMEDEGYQYGEDAMRNAHVGYNLALTKMWERMKWVSDTDPTPRTNHYPPR